MFFFLLLHGSLLNFSPQSHWGCWVGWGGEGGGEGECGGGGGRGITHGHTFPCVLSPITHPHSGPWQMKWDNDWFVQHPLTHNIASSHWDPSPLRPGPCSWNQTAPFTVFWVTMSTITQPDGPIFCPFFESRWVQSLSQMALFFFLFFWVTTSTITQPDGPIFCFLSHDEYNHSTRQLHFLSVFWLKYNHLARQFHFLSVFWVTMSTITARLPNFQFYFLAMKSTITKPDSSIFCFLLLSQWVQSLSQSHFLFFKVMMSTTA